MQSQRLSRILVLAFATCQLHVSYGEPHTAQYRFKTHSNWELDVFKTVFEYHTHFLDGAGADTFTVTKIGYCFIEVSITGSLRALQRVQDSYCVRDPQTLLIPDLFVEKITCLTELPSEKDNLEMEVGFIWLDMKEKNFVCVYQMSDFASNDCRKCLMQNGDSILGDFNIRLGKHKYKDSSAKIESIAYVMYTSRGRDEIINACNAMGVCHEFEHESRALSASCQAIHGPYKSHHFASEIPDKQHTSSSESGNTNLKCLKVYKAGRSVQKNVTYERVNIIDNEIDKFLRLYMRKNIVYWMKASAHYDDYTLLLAWYPDMSTLLTETVYDSLIVNEVPLTYCYDHYKSKLDISAFRHQSVLYPPKRVIDPPPPKCVVAYSKYLEACASCINKELGRWKKASAISVIFTLSTDDALFGNCITTVNTQACSKFEYIDDVVCNLDPASNKKTTTGGIYLRDSYDAHESFGLIEEGVSVVKVNYDSLPCLTCLVLMHSVKFISTVHEYVWMELKPGPWSCYCGSDYQKASTHTLQTLRQISVGATMEHLFGWGERKSPHGNILYENYLVQKDGWPSSWKRIFE